ncbi:MAG: 2-(1,2-epoxy-1,2-dihydrophenyl)acetyl-CoA isomerase [Betaproteobacteria bacterium]|nr:2-(1,2-epoxy-1,2-dihydrophenyl)acetyl-CoA isomerase [Betaproteobacteria bacterium]
MSFETILFELRDGVARITLNRPERLNSFNVQMHNELREALDEARANARAVLLAGAGHAFCAGQDLSDRVVSADEAPPDLGWSIENFYKPLVLKLRALEMPVICAVHGVAAGAGANIALACDLVLAARSASFVQAFCKVGLMPDSGGTWWLPRLVGPARAMGLAMLGERLGAEEAQQWGLIWRCVADEDLMAQAERLALQLAAGPTRAYARMKEAINAAGNHTLEQQLDVERDFMRELGRSDDYRERVAAFLDKREPGFTGR